MRLHCSPIMYLGGCNQSPCLPVQIGRDTHNSNHRSPRSADVNDDVVGGGDDDDDDDVVYNPRTASHLLPRVPPPRPPIGSASRADDRTRNAVA